MGIFDRLFGKKKRTVLNVGAPQMMNPNATYNTNALDGTTISRDDFQLHVMRQPFSKSLWRASDLETAYDMVDALWEQYVDPMPGARAGKAALTEVNIDAKTVEFQSYVNTQVKKLVVNKEKIQALFAEARAGRLQRQLRTHADGETEAELFLNVTPGNNAAAQARRPNEVCDVAVDWIIRSSATLSRGVTHEERVQLRSAIHKVVNHRMDVLDLETLRFLFAACGKKDMVERYTTYGAFYGDTVIGRYLHKFTLEEARRLNNFAVGNPDLWLDIALATLSGLIIAHGFADSNGRSGRALYASILLQKYTNPQMLDQRPFIAPDYRWLVDFVQPTRDWHNAALP